MALLLTAGCGGDGIPRGVVSGEVRLGGRPVMEGHIRFIPQTETPGPLTIAAVRDGKYLCDIGGGVPLGKHRVEILAWDPTKVPVITGPGAPARPQLVPAKYNKQSELVVTIDNASEPNVRNFDLK